MEYTCELKERPSGGATMSDNKFPYQAIDWAAIPRTELGATLLIIDGDFLK
jgi:hypothetical protein